MPLIYIEKEYIEIFRDTINKLNFDDVTSSTEMSFISYSDMKENFSCNSKYWLKHTITNTSDKYVELIMKFVNFSFLDLYIVDKEGAIETIKAVDMLPASRKQFKTGGEKGKKFMTKAFKNLLPEIYEKPMTEQTKIPAIANRHFVILSHAVLSHALAPGEIRFKALASRYYSTFKV